MLAKRRKHKVKGRTKILTSSTNPRKGIKYQGEFKGNKELTQFIFKLKKNIL